MASLTSGNASTSENPEQLLAFAFSGLEIGTWSYDFQSGLVTSNVVFATIFYAQQQKVTVLRDIYNLVSEGESNALESSFVRMSGEPDYDQLHIVVHPLKASAVSVLLTGRAIRDENRKPLKFVGTAIALPGEPDHVIPDGIRVSNDSDALKLSEARFRSLIDEAPVATCLFVGEDMVIEVANDIMIGYWGKDRSVIGKPLSEAVPELAGQPFLDILKKVYETGESYQEPAAAADLELNGKRSTYYFDFTYKPLRNADGQVYAIMDMAVDVTQRANYLAELSASEERFRAIIATAPAAVGIFLGKEFVIDLPNERFIQVIGHGPDISGKRLADLLPELEAQNFIRILNRVYETGEAFEVSGAPLELIKDGRKELSYFNVSFSPLRNAAGEIYGILDISIDVTESVLSRRQVEMAVDLRTSQLRDSMLDLQRSNANLSQFAYVASHDLQEPLRKIQTFAKMLRGKYGDLSEGDELLRRMEDSATRMSLLIKDLLSFSEISTNQQAAEMVSLSEVLTDVLSGLELRVAEAEADIRIEKMPIVKGDRSQLQQLFDNLMSNAIKFRRSGVIPIIEVSCKLVARLDIPLKVVPTRSTDQYYQIDVVDNGIGFNDQHTDRIFQVFQRLHGRNEFQGTGVGLAICEKVAANHGGAITATSKEGTGSTFSVYLPA